MSKITLCGSTKFKYEYEKWNKELSLRGHIVYSVGCYGHSGDILSEKEKTILDRVHMEKIANSDEIFVLDVGGYIGKSTKREIEYAKTLNKKIVYLSEIENKENKE